MRLFAYLKRPVFFIGAVCFALSCGYRPMTGRLPDGVLAVAIPIAQNKTAFSGPARELTSALRRKIAAAGIAQTTGGPGTAELRAVILSVNKEAGMLRAENKTLRPLDEIWHIEVEAFLEDEAGNILTPPERFSAAGRSFVPADSTPATQEAAARERRAALLDDIADAVTAYLFFP